MHISQGGKKWYCLRLIDGERCQKEKKRKVEEEEIIFNSKDCSESDIL